MVTINFGTFLKMTFQYGLAPIPEARLDVINIKAEKQEAKGLVSLMTKSGEIIWVHLDVIKDE